MVHRITVNVDNQTPFRLVPQGHYTKYGELQKGPISVPPQNTPTTGNGGVFQASAAPWVGSAGMVGYQITDGANVLNLAFLASDPDWSAENNRTRSMASVGPIAMDEGTYDRLFDGYADLAAYFAGGVIKVHSDIGTADDCNATFSITYSRTS